MPNYFLTIRRHLGYLLLALFFSACSEKEDPIVPTADFTYQIDPTEPGRVWFNNLSKLAAHSEWDFGDGRRRHYNSNEANPLHTYFSNDTFQVTLTTFPSVKGNGKLPGNVGGLGKKITKQVIINNARPIFTARVISSEIHDKPFTFSGIEASVYNFNNALHIVAFDGPENRIALIIPASATAGSTFTFNPQQPTRIGRLEGSFYNNSYYAHATSCQETYGTITITSITPNNIQGTFSGKLKGYYCGIVSMRIETGAFNFDY